MVQMNAIGDPAVSPAGRGDADNENSDHETTHIDIVAQSAGIASTNKATDCPIATRAQCIPAEESERNEYDDPRSWSAGKKIATTAVVCLMTLALTFSSSAYTSSLTHIMCQFSVSRTVALLGISLFVAGFATGPLLFGPFAQIFGHRRVFIATYLCFTAMSFAAAESTNVGALIAFRLLAGIFGSSSLSNAPAVIGDMTGPRNADKYLLFYGMGAFGGPGVAPIVSSFVDVRAGWRWNMRVQAIFVTLTTVACIVIVPETNHAVLKARAQAKHQRDNGNLTWTKKMTDLTRSMKTALSGPFVWLFMEPVLLVICAYLSILYTVLYLTFLVIPLAFEGQRKFGQEATGIVFISLLVGILLGAGVFITLQQRHTLRVFKLMEPGATLQPEIKLRQATWASIFPPIGLFVFAWTSPFEDIHWMGACVGMSIFTFGMFICFTSLIPYLVAFGGQYAPLLLAAATFTRSLMAAAFPLFGVPMFNAMTIQGGCSMLAGVCLLLTPLPLYLTFRGAQLRSRSKQRLKQRTK